MKIVRGQQRVGVRSMKEFSPQETRFTAGKLLDKFEPATGKLIHQYPILEEHDVKALVSKSREVLPLWRQTSLKQRQQILQEVAKLIIAQGESLAHLISQETGKPLKESLESDLTTASSILHYFAKIGPNVLRDKRMPLDKSLLIGRIQYERRIPRGVIGIISPWNYPFAIPVSGMAAALMGGNTVVLKPSELTPGVGEKIGAIFQEVLKKHHLHPEIVQVATGDGLTGKALTESDIDYAIFTGGDTTGFKVRSALQSRGKEASLELGGSDPMIVLDSAKDLDAITTYALWGRFTNTGQTCAAVKRLFVPKNLHDEIVSRLKEKIGSLRQGPPEDTQNHIGPLISENQLKSVDTQVQDAINRGAKVITGGKIKEGPGWFYEPTLLTHVPPEAKVLTEEVFGPVLPVIPYENIDEAVKMANSSKFGLTGSVFGEQHEASKIGKRLEVGVVAINDVGTTHYATPSVPWHGFKLSGPGVSHNEKGLLETTLPQTLSINYLYEIPFFRKQPWHFSPEGGDIGFSKELLRSYSTESLLDKLRLSFLKGFFNHRSSKKL